jgi:SAM-dependent methyltransferase
MEIQAVASLDETVQVQDVLLSTLADGPADNAAPSGLAADERSVNLILITRPDGARALRVAGSLGPEVPVMQGHFWRSPNGYVYFLNQPSSSVTPGPQGLITYVLRPSSPASHLALAKLYADVEGKQQQRGLARLQDGDGVVGPSSPGTGPAARQQRGETHFDAKTEPGSAELVGCRFPRPRFFSARNLLAPFWCVSVPFNLAPENETELNRETLCFVLQYFHYYGMLQHQQNMLQDYVRTGTYFAAIIENAVDFSGKAVLDVGCGSGILSLFAAQAGARVVYAVEASEAAKFARLLAETNPAIGCRVKVLHGKVEEVELPEKVDVMVSEPMGTLLVNERMLESYVYARNKHLKPGGRMFPVSRNVLFGCHCCFPLWVKPLEGAPPLTFLPFFSPPSALAESTWQPSPTPCSTPKWLPKLPSGSSPASTESISPRCTPLQLQATSNRWLWMR